MNTQESPATEYTMGRSEAETHRLIQQAELVNTFTQRLLEQAGITAGMKVLDVGSGAGDVAMLAARLVGPTGSVIGLDANPDILRVARQRCIAAGLTQVTLLEDDLRTVVLDNDFDAVVGRYVLLYVPDPAQALRSLATHLRPNGVVAFQEVELTMVQAYLQVRGFPDLAVRTLNWFVDVLQRSGANPAMGFQLYQTYQQAGLGVPQMEYHALLGGPAGWAGYDMTAELFRSILPLLEKYDLATAEEVGVDTLAHRYQTMVARIGHPFIVSPCVTAWARIGAGANALS